MGFAVACIAVSTTARWCFSLIRPDIYFTPYFPAVFFATAFGGFRIGIATAFVGGLFGMTLDFGDAPTDLARLALLSIYLIVMRPHDLGGRALPNGRLKPAGNRRSG